MSAVAKKLNLATTSQKQTSDVTSEIKNRRSQELIIALCGAVGSGIPELNEKLQNQLENHGYKVHPIKLSSLIIERTNQQVETTNRFERYKKLQDLGDQLRSKHTGNIVAQLAIEQISTIRMAEFGQDHNESEPLKVFDKVAYIIDQVKHPSEIELFREVYRNNFYLIGLLRTENDRKNSLKEEQILEPHLSELIERDRKASQKYGQHVEDSFHQSDYFIQNIGDTRKLTKSVDRFIELIHGIHPITPTKDEAGIYAAYSASLKSACLSRQVGAAITDDSGLVISTGCNDVPKFGGGLYDESSNNDGRCFNHGQECYNDKHKNILKGQINDILQKYKIINSTDIAEEILKDTKAKSLIEYSRAIHAEMDAIIALARSSLETTNKTLYCTTYPCHICARHIVASGIKRVVYIEPYEKSLAMLLHSDAIYQSEGSNTPHDETKVCFEMFEGASPRRYSRFFSITKPRKDANGKAISYKIKESGHVDPQHLDSYVDYESKVILNLKLNFPDPNIKTESESTD